MEFIGHGASLVLFQLEYFGFGAIFLLFLGIALLTVAVNFVVDWFLHKTSGLKE